MQTLSIGELSGLSGVSSQAIRFYEKEKLMPAPQRSSGNYRRYPLDAIDRLDFIVHAKRWGFTLDEIRDLLILQDANGDRAQVKQIAEEKLYKIREQINQLSRIEAVLSRTLTECTGEGPMQEGCPIVEAIAAKDEWTGE